MKAQDILLWPDGAFCFRDELHEMSHKSDDFTVLPEDTPAWTHFMEENQLLDNPISDEEIAARFNAMWGNTS